MKTALAKWGRWSLLLGTLVIGAAGSDVQKGNFGAERSDAAPPPHAREKGKRNSYPFSGELEAQDAKSLTLKGKKKPRILLLTPATRILKNGAPAKLDQALAGERVSGSARKNAEGNEEAATIQLKGKPEKPPAK